MTTEDHASDHKLAISAGGAVVLLVVYATWLRSYLRSDVREETDETEALTAMLSVAVDCADAPCETRAPESATALKMMRFIDWGS